MARPPVKKEAKNVVTEDKSCLCSMDHKFEIIAQAIDGLAQAINLLEKEFAVFSAKKNLSTINKVEEFNGEEPTPIDGYSNIKMGHEDKIRSMVNAINILPPNLKVDGRHLQGNIQAICGFMVTDEMLDEAYKLVKEVIE